MSVNLGYYAVVSEPPQTTTGTYTFHVELLGTNPVVSRTFTLPACSTFQRLHHAIQYSFGWKNTHLHEFLFEERQGTHTGMFSFDATTVHLKIGIDDEDNEDAIEDEKVARLQDVWEDDGKFKNEVTKDGRYIPLFYLYDFGDHWEHKVELISKGRSTHNTLNVLEAIGCCPLDDAGGVSGWKDIKTAFSSSRPNARQRELISWARRISALGSAFNPRTEPNKDALNRQGEFARIARLCKQGEGNGHIPDESLNVLFTHNTPTEGSCCNNSQPSGGVNTESLPRIRSPPIQDAHEKRRFIAPEGILPLALFSPANSTCTPPGIRWAYTDNAGKVSVLIFTDGACLNNGLPNAQAGCGVVFSPTDGGISFPLEHSPRHAQTSNRAELQAVIAALTLRDWSEEGFSRIVIGTDSQYVASGSCEWVMKWTRNGWKTNAGEPVKNRDLWERLVGAMVEKEEMGVSVQFYRLKREWNGEADRCAKQGAQEDSSVPGTVREVFCL